MSVIGELLFWSRMDQAGLSDVLRHNLQTVVPSTVANVSADRFKAEPEADLIARLTKGARIEPLHLHLDKAAADVREIAIAVRGHFGETASVPGLRVAKIIPFDGEADLFRLRPDSWGMNPPRGEVSHRGLTVGMEVRESEAEAAMRHIEDTLGSIQECIASQRVPVDSYNAQVVAVVSAAVARRRQALGTASDLAARLRGR